MPPSLQKLLLIAAGLLVGAVFFYVLSLLLAKSTNGVRGNFCSADEPNCFNKEFKIEACYPLFNSFVVPPIKVLLVAGIFYLAFDQIPHQIFADRILAMPVL